MGALERLVELDAVKRLRERDATLYSDDIDGRIPIMQRLGWTDLAAKAPGRVPLLEGLSRALQNEEARDVVLIGMGGSSLAPLVFAGVFGSAEGYPRLHVLDSTSPVQVTALLGTLDPDSTYVLVASKSGTTIETLSLYAVVRGWMMDNGLTKPQAGRHCTIITDPGSPLEKMRQRDLMRMTLTAPATVGGRYSALSMFGLAPAALIGLDVRLIIERAQAMEQACGLPAAENPAAVLAAWMIDALESGRDKLTIVTSAQLHPMGLWIEQLVAESLGKSGKSIVPVLTEGAPSTEGYSADRAVVVIGLSGDEELGAWSRETAAAHPVIEIVMNDVFDLGSEFVRWEHAVALAGALMHVNPFNEPEVATAKANTNAILAGESTEVPRAAQDLGGTWITYAGALAAPSALPADRASALQAAFSTATAGDYIAVLAFLPEDEAVLAPLRAACQALSRRTGRAVCLELGPRYLHSSGQMHKGGANNGVFLMVTARDRADMAIPGKDYGLAALYRAQAEGDLEALAQAGRRVARFDLPSSSAAEIASLAADIETASAN